jgi:hypothetical protein
VKPGQVDDLAGGSGMEGLGQTADCGVELVEVEEFFDLQSGRI